MCYGTGTVVLDLSSPATYAGQTGIVSATLDLGQQENELPPSTQVSFLSASGQLGVPSSVLAVHANTAIGSLLGGGIYPAAITIDHGATLTLAVGNPAIETQYYAGSITGDGGVTFTGDGGNRFPGSTEDGGLYEPGDFSYTYEGPTLIEGNTATGATVVALYVEQFGSIVNGSIPNSTITVAGGGELDLGPGSVVGPVIGAGGTIVPYPGAATSPDAGAASLTLHGGTRFLVSYAGPDAGTTSFLAVAGAVSLGGASLVATSGASLAPQGPVVVVSNRSDAGVAGTFATLPEGATFSASGGGLLKISYVGGDGNDITLEVPLIDAGSDAGPDVDAAGEGTGSDATSPIPDGGSDDSADAAVDANVLDATAASDAAPLDAGEIADGALSPDDGSIEAASSNASGCSCEMAGVGARSHGPGFTFELAFGVMALVAVRWRRPQRRTARPRPMR